MRTEAICLTLIILLLCPSASAQWLTQGTGWPSRNSINPYPEVDQSTPGPRNTWEHRPRDFGPCGDTFSIVAIDTVTREIGSAGASCIEDVIWISSPFPNRGVVHTQAYSDERQRNYARWLMSRGLSPQELIDTLVAYDTPGYAPYFQYGVVDLIGGGRSAAYTGSLCSNWKGHLTGTTYAIQGNILLGPQILDSMKVRFLHTSGTLAERLMAALQGAKVRGADTRCWNAGTSSISAFIRVVRPNDTPEGPYFLELNVDSMYSKEPIDSLQALFTHLTTDVILLVNSGAMVFPAIDVNVPYRDTTFVVRNEGGKTDSVHISLNYANVTPESAVTVSPTALTIAPGASQLVTFKIRPRLLAPGDLVVYKPVVMIDARSAFGPRHFEKPMYIWITGTLGVHTGSSEIPQTIVLRQNYPNPFNPSTNIKFELPKSSEVRLAVFDMLGREVSVLVNDKRNAGVHEVKFDGSGLSSGVYFCRLLAGDFVSTKRMLILK